MTLVTRKKSVGISQIALRRSLCRESYYDFVKEFWSEIDGAKPIWNWHIKVLCNEIQKVCERIFKDEDKLYDLVINVPPGSTKSMLCSIMLLPWLWTRMPSLRFLGGSFNAELAMGFGNKARRIIKGKKYQETFPEIQILADQDTKSHFANTLKGERMSTSTGASIIGVHFHLHVIDDPINPKEAKSVLELRKAHEWMVEAVAQRCVRHSLTPLILVMQRLGVEDPSGLRLSRRSGTPVNHFCFPAEIGDNVYPPKYKLKYKHGLLDPIRLPKSLLDARKHPDELGPYGYAGQFEQRPIPLTGGMIPVDKIISSISTVPGPDEFKYVVRWWDKAATQGSGDWTVGVLMGMKKNRNDFPVYWILDVVREQLNSTLRERLIVQTANSDKLRYPNNYKVGLEQEPGSGGKDSVVATTQKLDGFHVVTEKPTGSKMDRANEFASQVGGQNVAIAFGGWNKTYLQELEYFGPLCKHDDQVDATTGAFNFLYRRKLVFGGVNL